MKDEKRNEEKEDKGQASEPKTEDFSDAVSDFEFLQEKIKERPVDKKKLLRRTITTASLAVLFGVLACLSFLLLEPVLNNWLYPEEEPGVVTFPQEKNEMLPEDMLTEGSTTGQEESGEADESESRTETGTDASETGTLPTDVPETESTAVTSTETVEGSQSKEESSGEENSQEVHGSVENPSVEAASDIPETEVTEPLKPYQTQYEELYSIYQEVEPSMVTVTGVRSNVDWFNNPYQSEGSTAGVIIANNNRELLILSRKSPLDGAETIRIRFYNNVSADAVMKQYDKNTDLAVLAVDLKYIGGNTLQQIVVATLGSSVSHGTSGITGTPVIAVGNLFGYKDTEIGRAHV